MPRGILVCVSVSLKSGGGNCKVLRARGVTAHLCERRQMQSDSQREAGIWIKRQK